MCVMNMDLCAAATPSAPSGITLLSCDGSSMTVAWKSPKHCGGSKVNAYYIDKRNADTLTWKEVNLAPVTERICTVSLFFETFNRSTICSFCHVARQSHFLSRHFISCVLRSTI